MHHSFGSARLVPVEELAPENLFSNGWSNDPLGNDFDDTLVAAYTCRGSVRARTHVSSGEYEEMIEALRDIGVAPLIAHWNEKNFVVTISADDMRRVNDSALGYETAPASSRGV